MYVISGDTRLRTDIMSLPKEIKVFYLPERKFKEPRISFISNLIRLPLISNKLKTILGEIKPDILHAHSLLYGLWGAKACYHPFIVTPYGSDAIIYTRKYKLYRELARYTYKKADLITQDSLECQKVSRELGIPTDKSVIIQNGVDTTRFNPSVNGMNIRRNLRISEKTFLIFHCRDMKPLYNVENVIQSFYLFQRKNNNAKLVLAYLLQGTEYEKKIISLSESMGIKDKVLFYGRINYDDMPAFHAASDIHLSIPLSDSMPSSVTEAMATGRPVIISRLPWTEYCMEENKNCLLVDPHNPEEISNAMFTIYSSQRLKNNLIQNGIHTVKKYVDYHRNMDMMEHLMEDLIKKVRHV